jgi:predicted Zn-dependent protease
MESLLRIDNLQKMMQRKTELETKLNSGQKVAVNTAFELLRIYNTLQEAEPMKQLLDTMLRSDFPPEKQPQLADMLMQMKQDGMAEVVMTHYLKGNPEDIRIWIELAVARIHQGKTETALDAVAEAVKRGGEPVRNTLRHDERFQPLWNNSRFRQLVPPPATRGLPFGTAPFSGISNFSF